MRLKEEKVLFLFSFDVLFTAFFYVPPRNPKTEFTFILETQWKSEVIA